MTNSTLERPNWFKRFITAPVYPDDEDKTRAARLLHAILMMMWVVLVVGSLATGVFARRLDISGAILIGLGIPVVVSTVLLHTGRVRAGSITFIVGAWVLLTFSTLPFGGSISPTVNSYILVVIIAGLLLGGRGAIVAAVINIATLTVLLFLTEAGVIQKAVTPTKPEDIWANVCIGIGISAALLYMTTNSINQALTTTRRTSAALQQTNRELNAIRASLEERVAERTSQLNVSAEVAQAVSSILEPHELLAQVTRLIVERFNLYYAAAFLVDEDNEFARLVEATGNTGQTLKERGHRLEISGPSLVSLAIATRQPRLAQDMDKETMRFANPLLTETKSEAALPLMVGNQILGALDVQSTRAAAFEEETVTLLQGLANQIAVALNNAQQYQLAQLDARQASLLFEASQAAGFMGQGLDFAINRLFGVVTQRSEFDNWMMGIYDRESRSYTVNVAFDANPLALAVEAGQIINIDHSPATPATLALQANQMLVVNIPEDDPQLDPMRDDHRAALGKLVSLPVKLGERTLGVLTLGRALNKSNIGPRDVQLAQALASQLAVAIENHRLLEQSRQSVEELNRLMRLYMHEGWSSFSQSRAADKLRGEYQRSDAPPLKPEVLTQIDEALSQAAATNEIKPLAIDGQSVVSVPIELRGEVFGALTVQDDADRQWTADELATLQSVAAQVAQSLEAARLLEESETSLQDTMVLYRTSRSVAAAQTPAEILQAIASAIVADQVDRAALVLLDIDSPADDQVVEVIAAWERNNPTPEQVGLQWHASQLPWIKRQRAEPTILNDLAHDQDIDPQSRHIFMNVIGAQSMALIPMIASGRMLGWVLLQSVHELYNFSDQEIRRYRTLAGQAAVALENRRLFQDVQARVNELTILTRIGRRLASTLNLDEILSSVIEEAFNATRAANGGILLYNEHENALEVRTLHGLAPELEAQYVGMMIHADEGLVGRVLSTGEALLSNDITKDPDYREIDSRTRSEMVLPIRQGGLLLGVVNLESPLVNAFSESEMRLLEAMADQAAVAITNARAYEAERQAVERMREVDRLKTQFLANMSHELRTPLNSIIGFSRVMLRGIDGPLTDMQSTDLTSIYNSGQHLLGLINNMLDLSKIEAGKMELTIEPVNLVDVGKTVMSTALALVKDKTVKLEQDVPQDLPTVMADQTRVRQIILNLVSNAAKFTEKGSIRLRMVAMPKEVMISVSDTGIGIPQDKIEHIFEEFTQVDASTTRKYGGTGLGLAITRKFVEMHKGRIWVESQVGIGSTFNFTLPREQAEPDDVSLPVDLVARGAGKKLILCIDDDPGVITLYKRYLEKQDYQVIGVTDPTKAVEEAKRLLPYAITLDVMMPRKDGWDVLAELKKTPEISNTPILICSIIQDKTRGFSLGAADYLVKPITEDELRRALERISREHSINKILVVDDEPSAVQLLKRILESKPQYKVLDASGGAQALSIVEHDKPDLILLDLMMPEVDGFAVLNNIKSNPVTHDIPVIVVTAKEITAEDRERLNGHMAALYNKGMFTAEQLLADISTALQTMNGEIAAQGKKVEVFHKTTT